MTKLRCFLVAALLCVLPSVGWAAPRLSVAEPEYDFGQIFQGESTQHEFHFTNVGDEPLLVTKVRSSCGCTAALASSSRLQPGESGEIQATFDSTRFRGPVTKTIYLYTNDLSQPVAQLFIKGTVREMIKVVPKQLNLGAVPVEQQTRAEVTLTNQGDRTLNLGKPETTAPELLASLEKNQLAGGEQTEVIIYYTPKPGQVRFSGYVTIAVDGLPRGDLRIPVYGMTAE